MLDLKTTILAIVSALLFGALCSWWITADFKEAKYQAVISHMKLDAAEALRLETNKVRAIEAENVTKSTHKEVFLKKTAQWRLGLNCWECPLGVPAKAPFRLNTERAR